MSIHHISSLIELLTITLASIIGRMKIVDKCYGDKNKGGGFGFYYVDQRSQGVEGDSWIGEFYLPMPGGKFLEVWFDM